MISSAKPQEDDEVPNQRKKKTYRERKSDWKRGEREIKQPQGKIHISPAHITHKISCTLQAIQISVMSNLIDMAWDEQIHYYLKNLDE